MFVPSVVYGNIADDVACVCVYGGCACALHRAIVPLQLADVSVFVLLAWHHCIKEIRTLLAIVSLYQQYSIRIGAVVTFVVVVGGVVVFGVCVGARLAVRAVRARVRRARRDRLRGKCIGLLSNL